MLRCQQYIEMMRTRLRLGKNEVRDALAHAKKFIVPFHDTYPTRGHALMAGLLAYRPDTRGLALPLACYSADRWPQPGRHLRRRPQHACSACPPSRSSTSPFAGPPRPSRRPPATAASPPASSLSQPQHQPRSASVCPIWSTRASTPLARNVPYAQHSKSHVENDSVSAAQQPGLRQGPARREVRRHGGLAAGQVKDLVTGETYRWEDLRRCLFRRTLPRTRSASLTHWYWRLGLRVGGGISAALYLIFVLTDRMGPSGSQQDAQAGLD